jgi:hypothetical protein
MHVAVQAGAIDTLPASKGAVPAAAGFAHSSKPPESDVARALFLRIASRAGNANLLRAVENTSDRLAFFRVIEPAVIAGCSAELTRLIDQYDTGRLVQVRRSVIAYHRKRIKFVPELLKEALGRSLSGEPRQPS